MIHYLNFSNLKYIFNYSICTNIVEQNIEYIKNCLPREVYIILSKFSHITTYNRADYYVVIGRCSIEKTTNFHIVKKAPNHLTNINSALYHSLLGNNGGFIPISDIDINKRLNGTWTYSKYFKSNRKKKKFNYKTCENWHIANYKNIMYTYESEAIHLKNAQTAYAEVDKMLPYVENKHIVVAPFNKINDMFIDICANLNIKYIIGDGIVDVIYKRTLPIIILDIEHVNLKFFF